MCIQVPIIILCESVNILLCGDGGLYSHCQEAGRSNTHLNIQKGEKQTEREREKRERGKEKRENKRLKTL